MYLSSSETAVVHTTKLYTDMMKKMHVRDNRCRANKVRMARKKANSLSQAAQPRRHRAPLAPLVTGHSKSVDSTASTAKAVKVGRMHARDREHRTVLVPIAPHRGHSERPREKTQFLRRRFDKLPVLTVRDYQAVKAAQDATQADARRREGFKEVGKRIVQERASHDMWTQLLPSDMQRLGRLWAKLGKTELEREETMNFFTEQAEPKLRKEVNACYELAIGTNAQGTLPQQTREELDNVMGRIMQDAFENHVKSEKQAIQRCKKDITKLERRIESLAPWSLTGYKKRAKMLPLLRRLEMCMDELRAIDAHYGD